MEPYEKLANAIILQAAKDYRACRKFLQQHPRTRELEAVVAEQIARRERRQAKRKEKGLPVVKAKHSREELLLKRIGHAEREIAGIERFFRSKWYRQLTDADGEIVLQKLQEEEWT